MGHNTLTFFLRRLTGGNNEPKTAEIKERGDLWPCLYESGKTKNKG